MSKQVLVAIAAGFASAVVFALSQSHDLTSVPIGKIIIILMSFFAHLPIFLVGLSLGLGHCVITAICGIAGVFFASGNLAMSGEFLFFYTLPALGMIRQTLLRHENNVGSVTWFPSGPILAGLSVYAAMVLLLAFWAFADHEGILLGNIKPLVENIVHQTFPLLNESQHQQFTKLLDLSLIHI